MFFVIGALVTPLSIIIAIFASIAMMLDLLDVLENRKFNKGFYSDTEFENLVKEERKDIKIGVVIVLALWLFAYVASAFAVYQSSLGDYKRSATQSEVMSYFGLREGESYPLIVGSRVDGTKGSVSGRFFWVDGSMMPASSLSVGFDSDDGRSYVLEFPMSNITFVKDGESDPSATVYLRFDESYGSGGEIKKRDCRVKFSWGFFYKKCENEELVLDSSTEQQGLATVVSRLALNDQLSITIVLSPEQYQEILTG